MTVEVVRDCCLWCFIINMGLLLLSFLLFRFGHDWAYRAHGRWFRLSKEQFDSTCYLLLGLYKIAIIMFNLVPYVALLIVG